MKIFFSEHNKDYGSYTFDYAVYAISENKSDLPEIYERGFLPYSNKLQEKQSIFYLARSVRVDLERFSDSSENRRVNNKVTELDIEMNIFDLKDFNLEDKSFRSFCLDYAAERFSGGNLSEERFDYITRQNNLSHIISFNKEGQVLAYIFCLIQGDIAHYWYAFFDSRYLGKYPIGKWLMWKLIDWAKKNNKAYIYLGTCYGEKALYKVRDFRAIEFFDGSTWNSDVKLLKSWCKADDKDLPTDRYKLP